MNIWDDNGERLYIIDKIHPDRKHDAATAAVLSWEARLDALKSGAEAPRTGPGYIRLRRY